MRISCKFLGLIVLLATHAVVFAAGEDALRAVRMKTSRQLKEILTELKVKVPPNADKETLRALALKHDAVSKWEELHPEKKKKPRSSRGGGAGGGSIEATVENLFQRMDANLDGRLSRDEMTEMIESMAQQGSGDKDMFGMFDMDMDDFVSKDEMGTLFQSMEEQRGGGGGGGEGGPQQPLPTAENIELGEDGVDAPDYGDDDEDLPLHEDL